MENKLTTGVFQVGILVSDMDECLRLFVDTLGMEVVFEARNQIQLAQGLSGVEHQLMNVLMFHGEGASIWRFTSMWTRWPNPARP